MFSFLKFGKKQHPLSNIVDKIMATKPEASKTACLILFHRKDKKVLSMFGILEQDAVKINKTYYFVNESRVYFMKLKNTKGKEQTVPCIDLYEGITIAFTPYENIDTRQFSELIQDVISLHIERGILENKMKKSMAMKQILFWSLIGIVGIFVLFKMFGK